jgi:hypothetical protein
MVTPDRNILSSMLALKVEKPEKYNMILGWIKNSLAVHALSMSEVTGEENTNIAKGRLKEIKELEFYFSRTEEVIREIDKNTKSSIIKPDYLS